MSKFKFKIDKDIIIDDSDTEKLERKKRKKVAKKLESEMKKKLREEKKKEEALEREDSVVEASID